MFFIRIGCLHCRRKKKITTEVLMDDGERERAFRRTRGVGALIASVRNGSRGKARRGGGWERAPGVLVGAQLPSIAGVTKRCEF